MSDAFLKPPLGLRARLAAFGKMLAYLLTAFLGALLVSAIGKAVAHASLTQLAQGGLLAGIARAGLLMLGVVILPSAVFLKIFKEPFSRSGWAGDDGLRLLGFGVAAGFGLLAAIAGILWLAGAVNFHLATPTLSTAATSLLLSAVLWSLLAAGEEGLSRGYAFIQASRALSFWPAALLSSTEFLYGHSHNPGETLIGVAATGLIGLALAYSLSKTGSLWFACGFHATWNFTQSAIFGFHNSGAAPPASLLSATVSGGPLLTGATAGPEGSILVIPAVIVLLWIIQAIARPNA